VIEERIVVVATPPATEPVTLTEAKAHLRVDFTTDDTYIGTLITAAREQVEMVARRALITQTLDLRLSAWPSGWSLALPRSPVQSVTSITYTDQDGNTGTMSSSDYLLYTQPDPCIVVLKPSKSWPSASLMPGPSIAVRYVAGYGLAAAVPLRYKQATLLLIAHWYENREPVVVGTIYQALPNAIDSLLLIDRGSYF
jgi:uncharacterized phiE125 gp8 family phage protein